MLERLMVQCRQISDDWPNVISRFVNVLSTDTASTGSVTFTEIFCEGVGVYNRIVWGVQQIRLRIEDRENGDLGR
jgi:hypothetical protein